MFIAPSRSDVNASRSPSGLTALKYSSAGWLVSLVAGPPSAGTLQRSPAQLKTANSPSGVSEGYCG